MFKELTPILQGFIQKEEKEGMLPIYFMKLILPWYQDQSKTEQKKGKTTDQHYSLTQKQIF